MKQSWLIIVLVVCVAVAGMLYVRQPDWHHHDEPLLTLRVGLLPGQNWQQQKQRFEPLLAYLTTKTGLSYTLVQSNSYDELLQNFLERKIDMANFGGLTFVKAKLLGKADPLVMRDIDLAYTSVFIVPTGSSAHGLSDLSGKRMCFGSKQSTSGHLMPRYFLHMHSQKIVPEEYFSKICYTGAHDKTAYAVRDGNADVGVMDSTIMEQMLSDGRLQADDLRIIWETPPFPDYVWAVHHDFARHAKIKITNAFLELSHHDPVGHDILTRLSANYYLPARLRTFEPLIRIANDSGMLGP